MVSYIGQRLPRGGGGFDFFSLQITAIFIEQCKRHRAAEMMKIADLNSEAALNRRGSEGIIGVKEGPHSLWDQEESPEAHHS